jgi:hypothetical protein
MAMGIEKIENTAAIAYKPSILLIIGNGLLEKCDKTPKNKASIRPQKKLRPANSNSPLFCEFVKNRKVQTSIKPGITNKR